MSQTTNTSAPGGVTHWRSLEQLQNTPEFQAAVQREFPDGIEDAPDEVSRRGFLSAVAASVALAGLTSCRKPKTHIFPFNKRPEGFKPGIPAHYATTFTRQGLGIGVLVRSSDGRPTKIEGNPLHPTSRGGADAWLQGELLNLYDPARSRHPEVPAQKTEQTSGHDDGPAAGHGHGAEQDPYAQFDTFWSGPEGQMKAQMTKQGAGLRVLCATSTSPTMASLQKKLLTVLPKARIHGYQAITRDQLVAASNLAFGRALETHVDYSKCDVVVSLDSDFLLLDGPSLRSAREFAQKRRLQDGNVGRLYVVESTYTTTGTMADHRFRVRNQDIAEVAGALAAELGMPGELAPAVKKSDRFKTRNGANWIEKVAADLKRTNGRSAVVCGPRQPAAVQALVHAINQQLGNNGRTVTYTAMDPALAHNQIEGIGALARDIEAGQVDVLVILDSNPVYDAPSELNFSDLLGKVTHTIHVGTYRDETGSRCKWHFNSAHELECWGDARAIDGTASIAQPLVAPLHGGVSALEFIGLMLQQPGYEKLVAARDGTFGLDLVRDHWKTQISADFENVWTAAVHDGLFAGSAARPETVQVTDGAIAQALRALPPAVDGFELQLLPDAKVWDGRYSNNSWMQELPDPLTKLTWDNAALIGMATARQLDVQNGDLLRLTTPGGATLDVPAWILPGQNEQTVTLTLGYGRDLPADCKVARNAGFDAYALRTSAAPWLVPGLKVAKAGGNYKLVCTQDHGTMVGRALAREATVEQHKANPEWAPMMSPLDKQARLKGKTEKDLAKSLWEERGYDRGPDSEDLEIRATPYQWGMVIDLNACTGCSACMIACVAENNVPMVGKTQVSRNREMFWIRTDRYFSSAGTDYHGLQQMAEDPQVAHQPVPCMQCENAPCESVCPVAATTHSPEGLNDMVYNRCIGTRYCSNNCPYKVRRFNFLDFVGKAPDTKQLSFNPDVTVRSRGVMEKCTYCVQRINGARIKARIERRTVADGEITPACAQSCPSEAITFGNLLDKNSKVSKLKASPLNYGILTELNTKPRTTYHGRIRNPNPELA